MLDERDLQALSDLIDTKIAASEQRMTSYMTEQITASEKRTAAQIKDSRNQVMTYIEAAVMPKFQVLAEGHELLLQTLAPKNRVEVLEEDVSMLKMLVRSLGEELQELKKAQ